MDSINELFDPAHVVTDFGFSSADFDFLNSSIDYKVVLLRETTNSFFKGYPDSEKAQLKARFRSKNDYQHHAAFFELILHEIALRHKAKVMIHPHLPGREKMPDFLVTLDDNVSFLLEAAVATYKSKNEMAKDARLNSLYDGLNRIIDSPNFFIGIEIVQPPKSAPPIRQIASFVNTELSKYDAEHIAHLVTEKKAELPKAVYLGKECRIVFEFIPKSPKARGKKGIRPLGLFSSGFHWVDHRTPLKNAIAKKATRYGDVGMPFAIAVNALGVIDEIDVMEALFGKEQIHIPVPPDSNVPINESRITMSRLPDGVWMGKKGPTNTRLSAVIVGRGLRKWNIGEADFRVYHNPWARYPLDSVFGRLPQVKLVGEKMKHGEGETLASIIGFPMTRKPKID